ncbi:DUF177 domain-containing protein [Demequina sp. NBRC 110054]|uniref:YceD family protein n=1 Tax=Demequina sp. NBRC 110054 TaxID=1570343 RepID=UPI001F3FC416|nr:YceD family protein [Demequina sp. NBRC 110054]
MSHTKRHQGSPYEIPARDIVGRPGTQRVLSEQFPAPAVLGTDMIGVAAGTEVSLDLSLDSVQDGIWISGTVTAQAVGECGRCLDEVRLTVVAPIQGLFELPGAEREDEEEEPEDVYEFDGETLDLTEVVRDAVADQLPFTPLCDPDCPGLCDQCGARLADDPGHTHEKIDPRWSALEALKADAPSEKKES